MRIRHLISTILAAFTFAITACGPGNVLKEGEVVGRSYDDPDSWWTTMCVAYNKNGWCSVSIPIEEHDDAHWYLTVTGRDEKGKEHEEKHEVTETLWNLGQEGVTVNFDMQGVVPK